MLHLDNVYASYGNVKALKGVSLTVNEGEIATVIGANGAGKSTTLRVITGLMGPVSGSITLDGRSIGGAARGAGGHAGYRDGAGRAPAVS